MSLRTLGVATLLVTLAMSCRSQAPERPATLVTFPAKATAAGASSITLEGAVWGTGNRTAVVFAHSYSTTQDAWAAFARETASRGFLALTFNVRGVGQSQGPRDVSKADLDLEGAVDKATALGAARVLVVGASMGGDAAIVLAARRRLAGVVAISAPERFMGLDALGVAGSAKDPILLVAARDDPAGAAGAARALEAAASRASLEIEPGTSAHGEQLLSDRSAGARVRDLVMRFLRDHRA